MSIESNLNNSDSSTSVNALKYEIYIFVYGFSTFNTCFSTSSYNNLSKANCISKAVHYFLRALVRSLSYARCLGVDSSIASSNNLYSICLTSEETSSDLLAASVTFSTP